jgi:hypothetical protein
MVPHDEERRRQLRARGLQQRAQRIAVFAEEQGKSRDWIKFYDIADWCARRKDAFVPDEAVRSGAYDLLRDDLLKGEFEEAGESHVLFLHPDLTVPMTTERIPRQARRMTRERLRAAIEMHIPEMPSLEIIYSQYLAHCWIPFRFFKRWLVKHDLPSSPSLFKPAPTQHVRAKARTEKDATKALATHLRHNEDITRDAAREWCLQRGYNLPQKGFRNRVWPAARQEAGLQEARAERKRKSIPQ